MVTEPQWGSFQSPDQKQSLESEYSQEVSGELKDEKSSEKPQWGNFLSTTTYQGNPDPEQEEGSFGYILRNLTSNASRIGEQWAGRFGNIEKFGKDVLSNFPTAGGVIGKAIHELIGPEKWESLIKGNSGRTILPTSEDFKDLSYQATNDYTKPKTQGEGKFQEFTQDVGAVLSGNARAPVNLRNPIAQKAINSLLIPAAANVSKNIVKDLGFGDTASDKVKMAVWLPLSLAFNVSAPAYASNLMNQGRQGLPNNLTANVPRFSQRLDAIERSPLMLSTDPRTALARQTLNGIRNDVANGQTNAQSLMTMYDAVNAAKRNRGMFELSRGDQAFARRAINSVRDAVRDEIMDVGVNHPEAIQNWQNGIRAWSTIHQSNAISNWIQSSAKGPYAKILSGPAAALFGVGTYGAANSLPGFASIGASGAIPATYKTGQALYRMWNDPNLANYYWRAISAAQEENLPSFAKNYNELNKKLEKSSVKPVNQTKKKK
jgi:hypothetical protein